MENFGRNLGYNVGLEFFNLRMNLTLWKETLSIEYFCFKMKSIADKLVSVGSPITEKDLMLIILNDLGPCYRDIATFYLELNSYMTINKLFFFKKIFDWMRKLTY